MAAMRLKFLPANQAYVFTFGDQITSMGDERFFRTRAQAVARAAAHGLKVAKNGVVSAHGPNPFENRTHGRRTNRTHGTRNRAGGRRVAITYEIVTPESAEEGEAEDRGWIDQEGVPFMSAGEAARFIISEGATDPSSTHFYPDVWYTAYNYNTDYRTGAEESRSYHPKGFNEREKRMIFDLVTGRR